MNILQNQRTFNMKHRYLYVHVQTNTAIYRNVQHYSKYKKKKNVCKHVLVYLY